MNAEHSRLPVLKEIQPPDTTQRPQEGIDVSNKGCESARECSQGQTAELDRQNMELSAVSKPDAPSMDSAKSQIARPPYTSASVPPLEGAVVTGMSKKRDYSTSALLNDFRRQSESDTDAEPPNSTRRLLDSSQANNTPRSLHHQPDLEPSTRSAKRLCTEVKVKVQDLFESDKALIGNVEWGLKAELTRTDNGGTDKTRTAELAKMVKVLRKAVRTYQGKVTQLQQFISEREAVNGEGGNTVDISADTDDVVPTADALRAQQLEDNLAKMTVALDEANGRISQLQAASTATAPTAAPSALRGDSVLSLEAQTKALETAGAAAKDKENEEERLKLQGSIAALNTQIRQLKIEVETLEGRSKLTISKYIAQVTAAEEEATQFKRELLEERSKLSALQVAEKASKAAAERAEKDLQSLRARTTEQLSDANANKGELWKQMMQAKDQAMQDRMGLAAQLADVQTALEAANARCDHEQGISSMLKGDKDKLKDKLDKAELEIKECERKLLEGEKNLVDLQEQAETAKRQAAASGAELAAALAAGAKVGADREDLAARVATLEQQFAEAESARLAAKQQCAGLQQDLDLLTQDAEGLKAAIVAATTERDALDAELVAARQELEQSAGSRSQVEAEREAMIAEKEELEAKVAALVHAKNAAEDKALAIEGQMEALQDVVGAGDQKQMVGQLVTRVGNLETALWEAEKSRRRNHNELMEVKGNIRVFCRLRPCSGAVAVDPLHGDGVRCLVDAKPHDFFFDRVLPAAISQEAVFSSVSDVIQSALDGYHVCLFSYGQTGSGKTYTMNGNAGSPGIIPRAVSMLLEASERLGAVGWTFRLEGTFIEVYNDVLKDLLAPVRPGTAGGGPGARVLDSAAIKHDPKSHTQVLGATKILVDSEEQAKDLLARAQKARSTDATAMNAESSRSHSVFTLCITGEHEEKGFKLLGSLNLVDLAGSERLARSQVEGQRQKETCAINKSLACLGDIFQALANKSGHIPYRNSKLTYLLQPCLGGDGKTLMFVNINPEAPSAYESLCALRFASKVNTVETGARGGAKRNVVSSGAAGTPDAGAPVGVPGAGGPGALPPLHRGNSESTLGTRSGLPRPSTGGPSSAGGRQSMAGGGRQSIMHSGSRGTSAGKSSVGRASMAPSMSGRSSSVPAYKRQR